MTSTTPPARQDRAERTRQALESIGNRSVAFLVIRGIISTIFGILVLVSPMTATAVLTPFLGFVIAFWMIASGITEIIAGIQGRRYFKGWGWDVAFGAIALIAGVYLLFQPIGTGFFFALLVLWLLAFSTLERAIGMFASGNGWGIGFGILYVVLAIELIGVLIANPAESVVALVWIAGLWGLVTGITSFLLAWQVQRARKEINRVVTDARARRGALDAAAIEGRPNDGKTPDSFA